MVFLFIVRVKCMTYKWINLLSETELWILYIVFDEHCEVLCCTKKSRSARSQTILISPVSVVQMASNLLTFTKDTHFGMTVSFSSGHHDITSQVLIASEYCTHRPVWTPARRITEFALWHWLVSYIANVTQNTKTHHCHGFHWIPLYNHCLIHS